MVVSNKVCFGKQGFKDSKDGYKDGKKNRHLGILLPKMSLHRKDFNKTKYMSFLIKDNESLETYNEI